MPIGITSLSLYLTNYTNYVIGLTFSFFFYFLISLHS